MIAHFIVHSFSDSRVTTSSTTLPYRALLRWYIWTQFPWSWKQAGFYQIKDKMPGLDGMHLKFFSPDIFPISSHICIFSAWTEILTVLQLLLMLLVTKFVVFILIDKLDDGRWCIGDQLSGLSAAQRVVWKITKLSFASSGPTPLLPQFVSEASQIIESNRSLAGDFSDIWCIMLVIVYIYLWSGNTTV